MFKVALLVLALIIPVAVVATKPADHKERICHSTNSATNPYVSIEVDYDAIDSEGQNDHMSHSGPVPQTYADAETMKKAKIDFGDIIPPVDGVTDGLNWSDGVGIWNNDCKLVEQEEPPEEPELPPVDEEGEDEPDKPKGEIPANIRAIIRLRQK